MTEKATQPKITVTERALQHDKRLQQLLETEDIFRQPSRSVRLRDPKEWWVYWANSSVNPRRIETIKDWGYVPVAVSDLDCDVTEIGATVSPSGQIVCGPRGEEILFKVPMWYHLARQQKKRQQTLDLTFNKKKVKEAVVGAVAAEHGPAAAEFMQSKTMLVKDTRERAPVETPDTGDA